MRGLTRQGDIQNGPQAIDIGGGPHRPQMRLQPRLFGGHEVGRSHHLTRHCQTVGGVGVHRDVEVGQLGVQPIARRRSRRCPGAVQQDIRRLEVPVNDPQGVDGLQRLRQLMAHVDDFPDR